MNLLLLILFCAILLIASLVAIQNSNRKTQTSPARHRGFKRTWRKLYLLPIGIERVLGFMPGRRLRCGVQFANIAEGTHDTGVKPFLPDAATTSRYLLYKIGSDGDHVAVTAAGDVPLGNSDDQADADVPIAINLLGVKPGTLRVVTDGTVANGEHVKCGASGKVTQAATTDVSFGIATIGSDQSVADGDVIEIIHCVPHKYVF
jgi:hypothetical protein